MFIGINLKMDDWYDEKCYQKGLEVLLPYKNAVNTQLKEFVSKNGFIDGTMLRNNWFPLIKSDIFLSHSHINERTAISLAGYFKLMFNLNTFIDSCVWGYADDLLLLIDKEHCLQDDGYYYSYQKRNNSTSHVHMLLSSALTMMIDRTECLIFLNTPDAIIPKEVRDKTFSPWIYSEIVTSQLVRHKSIAEHRKIITNSSFSVRKSILTEDSIMTHDLDMNHLIKITDKKIEQWEDEYKEGHALDTLYSIL